VFRRLRRFKGFIGFRRFRGFRFPLPSANKPGGRNNDSDGGVSPSEKEK